MSSQKYRDAESGDIDPEAIEEYAEYTYQQNRVTGWDPAWANLPAKVRAEYKNIAEYLLRHPDAGEPRSMDDD